MSANLNKGFLRLTIVLSILVGIFTSATYLTVEFDSGILAFVFGFVLVWIVYFFIKYVVVKFIINGFKK